MNYELAVKNIRGELKTYIETNKIQSLVIGISGGIDSCLCAALAKPVCDELNIPLIGTSLPISSNAPDEIERAKLTGKVFCTEFDEINLAPLFNDVKIINIRRSDESEKAFAIRDGNIKARLRMIYLYNLASMNNGMVLSTDNYTELILGFWTLHGDVGDYGMIQNLWKTEVYEMAEWIIDNECKFLDEETAIRITIEAMATDGLGVTNTGDLGQIMPDWKGTSKDGYKELDKKLQNFLKRMEYEMPTPLDEKDPVIQRHFNTEFKRNNPVNIPRNLIEN